jgi:hypothetical protein
MVRDTCGEHWLPVARYGIRHLLKHDFVLRHIFVQRQYRHDLVHVAATIPDSDADGNSDSNSYTYTDGNSNAYADSNGDTDAYTDSDSDNYADANTGSECDRVWFEQLQHGRERWPRRCDGVSHG